MSLANAHTILTHKIALKAVARAEEKCAPRPTHVTPQDLRVRVEEGNRMRLVRDRAMIKRCFLVLTNQGGEALERFARTELGMNAYRCVEVLVED